MNRVLKRPMFRMGGSSGTGITSGLDRKPYQFGTKPVDFPGSQQEYDAQMRRLTQLGIFDAAGQRTGGSNVEDTQNLMLLDAMRNKTGITSNVNNMNLSLDNTPSITKKSTRERLLEAIGKQPSNRNLSQFLTTFGLNLLSTPPSGGFFSTVAQAAKEPTGQLFAGLDKERDLQRQVSLAAEQLDIEQEGAEALQMLKNLDADDASAIKKQAQEGFEAGEYDSVEDGIRKLLQIKRFGIEDRPGEKREKLIEDLFQKGMSADGVFLEDEPVVRRKAIFLVDREKIQRDNEDITFGVNPIIIDGNTYEAGKTYYNAEQYKFYVYNGPEADQPFEEIDVTR